MSHGLERACNTLDRGTRAPARSGDPEKISHGRGLERGESQFESERAIELEA
jgi:hypothetical protein